MQLSKNTAKWHEPGDATPSVTSRKFVLQVAPRRKALPGVVGVTGVEPVTLRLSSACSNQLSYTPILRWEHTLHDAECNSSPKLVELRRLELLTYSLQSYRSTN